MVGAWAFSEDHGQLGKVAEALDLVGIGRMEASQEQTYATIIFVARKIPKSMCQEEPKLLMWYDQAVTRTGGG